MKTHFHVQRRTNTESSDPLIIGRKPAAFSDPQHEQPQSQVHDFSHVDLFSHAPQRAPIQMKLTVGAPNDVYEQEADRVADQVLSMPDSATQQPVQREGMEEDELQMKSLDSTIQREGGGEEDELQMKPLDSTIQREGGEENELQMKPTGVQATAAAPALETQLNSSQGSGSPLPDDVRSFMEPRFGADFSGVRVHTGAESVQMNQDLSAQAFTHKQDIYFGAGKSPSNDALTAHELTHVIQQNGAIAQKRTDSEALHSQK